MSEIEPREHLSLREITENISSIICRSMDALQETAQTADPKTYEQLKKIYKKLELITNQLNGLAMNFVVNPDGLNDKKLRQRGESYVEKLISLIRDLSNDYELWDTLPDKIRTHEGDQSDVERARERVRDWNDRTSKGFKDNFTHYQTGEILFTEDEIARQIKRQEDYIHSETIGEDKNKFQEDLKKYLMDLEQFYLRASRPPEGQMN